jgi:hypothetical protein
MDYDGAPRNSIGSQIIDFDDEERKCGQVEGGCASLLLVNRRRRPISLGLPAEFFRGSMAALEVSADEAKAVESHWKGEAVTLAPFEVVVLAGDQQ